MNTKRNIFLWALYDFANSIVMIAFLFYFSQWLVVDHGKPSWWFNASLVVSSALFIVSSPFLSRQIDRTKNKIKGLRLWTGISFLGFCLLSTLALTTSGLELLTTVLYTLSSYAYLICFLYFTPMLNDLSTDSNRSYISGIGQGANSIGQVAGVLVTLPFVNGITLFGDPGRVQAFLPATLLFGLLALPMLFLYREPRNNAFERKPETAENFMSLLKNLFSHKPLMFLFLGYFLFSDALITFSNNFALYLEIVHRVSDTIKSILTAGILVLASLGAVILGRVADKIGKIKILKIILIIWVVLFAIMAFVTNFSLLIPVFLLAGILFGPVWGISRALVGELSPPSLLASSYGYYVVAERFATFIGPLVWSITIITVGEGPQGYQAAMVSLSILLLVSIFALNRVKEGAEAVYK